MDLQGIRKARKAAKITQEELAQIIGVNRATISKYENGDIVPSLAQLSKIARVLKTNVYEMIGKDWSGIDWSSDSFPSQEEILRERLDVSFYRLNYSGQEKAVERIEELTEIPKYQRQSLSEGTDTSTDEKPPDSP